MITLLDTFQMTCSLFGSGEALFFLLVLHKEIYSPTNELVLSRKVEVIVQLQVSYPPLHPLLLDVCEKGKHLLVHNILHLQFRFVF